MLANRTSRWSIAAALLCLALLAASWFLLISPRRADASTVRAQVVQSDAEANHLKVKIAELKAQFADLPKQKVELKAIKAQLPPKANVPDLVRDLRTLAAQAGVSLDSLTPSSPVLLTAAGAPPPAAATAGSVLSMPLAITVTGDYFEASLFVKNLQTKLNRSMLITGIGVAPAAEAEMASPTTQPSATSTAAATPTPSPTATTINLDRVTLSITSSVFVLMDGTSTVGDVTKEAKAATAGKAAAATPTTPTTAPTSTAVTN